MAFFDGTARDIEDNRNKKSTFDGDNPSEIAYLSEAGVKNALESIDVPSSKLVTFDLENLSDVGFTFGAANEFLTIVLAITNLENMNFMCNDTTYTKMVEWIYTDGTSETPLKSTDLDRFMKRLSGYVGLAADGSEFVDNGILISRTYEFENSSNAREAVSSINAWLSSQGATWSKIKAYMSYAPEINAEVQNG